MTVEQLTNEIMRRSSEFGYECDAVSARELAALIKKSYEASAQDLAIEMLMNSMQELRK